jgi:hypothetical protein
MKINNNNNNNNNNKRLKKYLAPLFDGRDIGIVV